MPKIDYQTICRDILEDLPVRQKEVLSRRFGLNNNACETLQSIGNDFGITRERVRQLEKSGFLRLGDAGNKNLQKASAYFEKYLQDKGGLRREDLLLKELAEEPERNFVYFLLGLGKPFYRLGDDNDLYPYWALDKQKGLIVKSAVQKIKDFFLKANKPLSFKELSQEVLFGDQMFLLNCLEIAKHIEQGPLSKFGLVFWPEIKPKGVRDAAYLVLKKAGQPLHFREIAKVANTLSGELFSKRQMLPQTVHNELIRDPRFVLVGRGTYALGEWGYACGTVKDIIFKVLQAQNAPLSKEEVLLAVQKQRLVKPNTIFLNLSDKENFIKDQEGKYSLKTKTA